MIEFTLNRNRNGKKSRWAKRYPRKRILKRGSEKAAVWFVIFIVLLTLGLEMISAPNTIENVIGFLILVATVLISIKTKCLTTYIMQFMQGGIPMSVKTILMYSH